MSTLPLPTGPAPAHHGLHRRRPLAQVVVVAFVAATLLAACAGDDDAAPSTTTGGATAETSNGSSTTGDDGPCGWPTKADETVNNIAYPDTAATYWGQGFRLADGERLELSGAFPDARYASFITYKPTGGAVDVLTDRDIAPDEGSTNPFAGGDSGDEPGRFTITVRPDVGADSSGNDLGADTTADGDPPEPPALSPDVQDQVERGLLGTGGDDDATGTILYRVYTPTDPDDPTGGAGLPTITIVAADGTRTPVPTCAEPGESPAALALVNQFGPDTDRPAPPAPIFVRPGGDAARLYPNPDNVYVATIIEHEPGRIAVIRGRAPSFPDTTAGASVSSDDQVRYWSMCTNEYRKPYPVTQCATDAETVVDADGTFTFVISTPEDRPANATADRGVTWLDWGSTEVDGLLLLRHMLASDSFPQSAIFLEPGELATESMGEYAPVGVYCTRVQFEADDEACRAT